MSAVRNHLAEFASVALASIRRTFPAHLPLYICALVFVPVTAAITLAYDAPLSFGASLFFLRSLCRQFMVVRSLHRRALLSSSGWRRRAAARRSAISAPDFIGR